MTVPESGPQPQKLSLPIVFLNGRLSPAGTAAVSVFDRCFLYGDGLFETIRVARGQPFRWADHMRRLDRGAHFLRIPLSYAADELLENALELIRQNQMAEALLRLTLSRGSGRRGYSIQGANEPVVVMALHPAPPIDAPPRQPWRLITSSIRLPANDPLAAYKTCNKLPQILARAEAEAAGADEALLLNTEGHLAEASSANLFWIENGSVATPPLVSGALAGVTRAVTLELCQVLGVPARERNARPEVLRQAQGVFLTLTSAGIVEALYLDDRGLNRSALIEPLRQAYVDLVGRETASEE